MGYFFDAFGIGAGATLGSLAVLDHREKQEQKAKEKFEAIYTKYRRTNYDPIIRDDLNNLLAFQMLEKKDSPFKNLHSIKPVNYKNAAIIIGILSLVSLAFPSTHTTSHGLSYANDNILLRFISFILAYALIYFIYRKIKRKRINKGFKAVLKNKGDNYWKVREYIRESLENGEMNIDDAIRKLSNTYLAQALPDTVEEIEANAYNFKKEKLAAENISSSKENKSTSPYLD